MITVEVLYADLSRDSVPISQVGSLAKTEVLAIVVKTDDEVGPLQNIAMTMGHDKYALFLRRDGGQDRIMLTGWDDDAFVWRRLTNVHDVDARQEVSIPSGHMHMVFEGQSVTPEVWDQAMIIFNDEML